MTSTNRVVVVPCSGKKQAVPAPAGEMYLGSYHRACRATADVLTADNGLVLVLSSRYGLVTLDEVLEPYEMTFRDRGAVSDLVLRAQARNLGVDSAQDVTVLAGADYVTAARSVWPHASAPLTGLGIGKQRQRLAELRARAERLRTAQPVEAAFTDAPMYEVPYDYRQMRRPYTVSVAGPGRHEGEPTTRFVVEEYKAEMAWAKVLAWYMVEYETVDAYVVAGESFEGAPAKGCGFFWQDLRAEYARQEALDDLADQAAEAVAAFHEQTRGLAAEDGTAREEQRAAYEAAVSDAAFAAWPLVLAVADNDGRD
ncbi:DUF6884 domain-containing protein [Streptomyces murinus]|uniref:DUF6884 domain-containing protein n=1 Tax=Streptomyces murinus TaxID=33900 RepID=UPI0018F51095|nr:DUF6884 domain-containing protein [Streptomyces murinus]